jgi:hypothetical protein
LMVLHERNDHLESLPEEDDHAIVAALREVTNVYSQISELQHEIIKHLYVEIHGEQPELVDTIQ